MARLLVLALALCLPVAPSAWAVSLTSTAPLYVVVDGRYYVSDVPLDGQGAPQGPLALHPRGAQGFFLHGFLTARSCTRPGGAPLTPATALRHDEALDAPAAVSLPLRGEAASPGAAAGPRVRLAFCPQATVVLVLRTPDGDAVCQGAVPSPFATGCAAVTAALAESAPTVRIFRSGFE